MSAIVYQRKFVRIAEYWNGEQPCLEGVDIERFFQQPHRIDGMFCRNFYTILIDLRNDAETLLSGMKRDTRYDIRRAQREDFIYDFLPGNNNAVFSEFCDYFDKFARQKSQPLMRRSWLWLLAKSGSISLTRIADNAANTLVWHGYHCTSERATLLYSASLSSEPESSTHRNMVGRANRYQHWRDMLTFKDRGISIYDLGGWYEGADDQKRLSINRFKEEFGGEIVQNYICERASTLKGSLFLKLRTALLGDAI